MAEAFDPYHKWFGIAPGERPVDYYRLLGLLRFEDDGDVIANAVDQRMAYVKTFQTGQHSRYSQQILNEIAAAKVTLLNPEKKARYDRQLQRRSEAAGIAAGLAFLRSGRFWQGTATLAVALVLGLALISFLLSKSASEKTVKTATRDTDAAAGVIRHTIVRTRHPAAQDEPAMHALPAGDPSLPVAVEPATTEDDASRRQPQETADTAASEKNRVEVAAPQLHPQMRAEPDGERPLTTDAAEPPVPAASDVPETVYLDDLEEVDFRVGAGTLGKHGVSGFPPRGVAYGRRVVFQGEPLAHALSVWPPAHGSSYVVYRLKKGFGSLRVTAAVLGINRFNRTALKADPLYMGRAYSPLCFKVLGDGKLLWRSRRLQTSGDWQDCSVSVENVEWLELHVECPGANAFAWAAWIDPRLLR